MTEHRVMGAGLDLPLGGTAIIAKDGATLCRALFGPSKRQAPDPEQIERRMAARSYLNAKMLARCFPHQAPKWRARAAEVRAEVLARIRARGVERRVEA